MDPELNQEAPPEPELELEQETEPETVEQASEAQPELEAAEETAKKNGFERRVDKLTAARAEAEAEAAYWRKLATKEPPQEQPPAQEKPKFSDYNDIELYSEAVADWTASRRVQEALQQAEHTRAGRSVLERYNDRVAAFKDTVPDFDEVFADVGEVQLAPELTQGILESSNGPALAYHLAKNTKEVKRLNALTPYQRLMELGKLEASLAKGTTKTEPAKKISSAPAAPKKVNPSNAVAKDESQMSPEEWIRYRNAQDKTLRRR